ncbi:hypothetical protein PENANT_c001G05068 [Penicillium antarcticum]|uniref:Rhodopsin domain-containing protein n=1 Tax=Penicillium antarcticum TaxID=416450 RepID=A0A1V6QPL1_9EURO|nr:uncharacterized protein N7508_010636 [Penicillium antarcticum]KAJ5295815.1 hypothetical protein N7508_010636 [Penicillium antarcticum]OQD90927.1 hypothetical protein PENANT_c001G05068 [Penicillium antarcticum]
MAITDENRYDNKGPKILAVLWTLTGLTALIVSARIYIRMVLLRNFGIDDYLILISMLLGLAYCSVTTAGVSVGYGQHAEYLSDTDLEMAILLNSISFLFGILSFTIPKVAVTAMLNRILNPGRVQKIILWVLVGSAAIVSVICILILFTMCDPPRALWQTSLITKGEATCKSTWILINYALFTGALSAFVDLYLAIYPTTVLLKLQMSLRKRTALCAALGLGAIASAMAIIKCTQLHELADKSDYTYGTADLVMWTNVEANIVVIASCIPTLQPLLEIILGKRGFGSYSQGKGDRYKGSDSFPPSSYNRNKHSNAMGKDELGFTNLDTVMGKESQESILPSNETGKQDTFSMGHIHRTDDVIVEYESASQQGAKANSSW